MERYHELANDMELDARQRQMYFRLGAEVQNRKSARMGFAADADYCHDIALAALDATGYKSLKAARAVMHVARM